MTMRSAALPFRSFADVKSLLMRAWTEWNEDEAPRLGAALAYYTTLSLAPLLILMIALAGLIFGQEAASGQLFTEIQGMVGSEGAKAIEGMVQNASKPGSGILASIIGFLTLVFGASSVASELTSSLNIVWDRKASSAEGIKGMVKERSKALGVILGAGFLLLVSLAVTSAVAAAGSIVSRALPLPEGVLHLLTFVGGMVVTAGVFAVLFRYLPDVHLSWNDVVPGAIFTSILFSLGKLLIGLYLGKASFGSTYGAAGSLVIVLVWVYYSAQIFFFGAEFTQVYSEVHGTDPLQKRGSKEPGHIDKAPKTAVATSNLPGSAAWGNAGSEGKGSGMLGGVLGSALAATKIFRGLRR
ncbi:MAG TPA: YihY/virulence factor BrkB family protein [Bryobacteraceae bacterium]|nr:YihY/virulence factor BrkB family protein [Bryobacteraceae bacterium]